MLYKNTCIIGNIYGLFVYQLMCPDDEIDRTLFFIDTVINKTTIKKAPKHTVWIDYTLLEQTGQLSSRDAWLFMLNMRLKYWWICFTNIFAQDNIPCASPIIGYKKYNEIEDAPYLFSLYKSNFRLNSFELPHSLSGLKQRLKKGPIWGNHLGRNKQCKNRYVSLLRPEDADMDLLKGKRMTEIKLDELWSAASEKKKALVLETFGIEKKDLALIQSANTIILTQPFMDDAGLSLKEQIDLYRPYVEKYEKEGVIIKPHPREKIDYKEFFPNITVLQSGIPMQVFNVLGTSFIRAITVCSTAVSSMMKDDTEIVWIGTNVHPKIHKVYGDVPFEKQ